MQQMQHLRRGQLAKQTGHLQGMPSFQILFQTMPARALADTQGQCNATKRGARLHVEDLVEAAKEGRLNAVRSILGEYSAAVNMGYRWSAHHPLLGEVKFLTTPIQAACAAGHLEVARLLLDNGADLHEGDVNYRQVPLHRVAQEGYVDVAQLLLERGADILRPDNMGQTPLHFAAEHGKTDMVRFLLENGAKPCLGILYRLKTPMMWALMGGHQECAALLHSKEVVHARCGSNLHLVVDGVLCTPPRIPVRVRAVVRD